MIHEYSGKAGTVAAVTLAWRDRGDRGDEGHMSPVSAHRRITVILSL